jgi:hypothetical protein
MGNATLIRAVAIAAAAAAFLFSGNILARAASTPIYSADDPDIHVSFELVAGHVTDAFCSPFAYHLGSLVAGTTKTVTFRIWNLGTGTEALNLTGLPGSFVEITKDDSAGKFSIPAQPSAASLAPSSTSYLQFQLAFTTDAVTSPALYSSTIRIRNNDPDEAEYLIPVKIRVTSGTDPELVLLQSTNFVPCGSGTDASRGSFDFGGRRNNQAFSRTFVIENAGTRTLNISNITSSSPLVFSPSAFSGAILEGQAGSFDVTYQSENADNTGTITISSDDPDYPGSAYFTFMTNGTATSAYSPKLALMQGCRWIPFDTQYTTPNIDCGSVRVKDTVEGLTGLSRYILSVKNTGLANMTASASSATDVTGTGAAGFGITDIAAGTTINSGTSLPLVLTFEPPSRGAFSATVAVHATYPDTTVHDCTFTVSGIGLAPDISLAYDGGNPLLAPPNPASTIDFLDVDVGGYSDIKVVTISNAGNAPLKIKSIGKGGAAPGDFILSSLPSSFPSNVPASPGTLTFGMQFHPTANSARNATITVENDDPTSAKKSYVFNVTGNGVLTPIGRLDVPETTPTRTLTQKGATAYYGECPLRVTFPVAEFTNATELQWEVDGDNDFNDVLETGLDGRKYLDITTPGLTTVKIRAYNAGNGRTGPESTVDIGAYPNESVSFPIVSGVPFDSEAPYIDGQLSGDDDKADPLAGGASAIYGENGWKGCFRIPFGHDGTDQFVGSMDLIRQGNFLYFGFEFLKDADLDALDQILIGIGQSADARTNDRGRVGRIILTPSAAVSASADLADSVSMKYLDAAGVWQDVAAASLPAGTEFKTKDGGTSWSAELKLPIGSATGQAWLDIAASFILFVKMIPHDPDPDTFTPLPWPKTLPADLDSPETNSQWWGLATRSSSAPSGGLYFAGSSSIGTRDKDHPGPADALTSAIKFDPPVAGSDNNTYVNNLVARVSNDARTYALDSSGEPYPVTLDGNKVVVFFKIANWGITPPTPQYWQPIEVPPIAGDPLSVNGAAKQAVKGTVGAGNVVTPTVTEYEVNWKLRGENTLGLTDQIDRYKSTAIAENGLPTTHQCIMAEIGIMTDDFGIDPSRSVNVITRSVARNMNFSAENPGHEGFSSTARITPSRGELLADKVLRKSSPDQKVLLRIYTREWKTSKKTLKAFDDEVARRKAASTELARRERPPAAFKKIKAERPYTEELRKYVIEAEGTISFTEYIVKAFVYTGKFIEKDGKRIDEVLPMGSYGYVVRHSGSVEGWDIRISCAEDQELTKLNDRAYILTLKKSQPVSIADHIRGIEPPRWSFGLLGGTSIGAMGSAGFTSWSGGGQALAIYSLGYDEKEQEVAVQAQGGYDYLPDDPDDWKTGSFSLALRTSLPFISDWSRWYCSLGCGVYQDSSSDFKVGMTVGFGLDIAVSRPVHLVLGGDFLGWKTGDALIHLNAGLLYRLTR